MLLAGSLFIVLSLAATCVAEHPGIKVRMMEAVLEEGVEYLVTSMTEEISMYNLPNVNGSTNLDDDEMTYELSNIKIMDFQFENVSSKFIPGTGAQITLHRGHAVINCQCDLDSWLIKDDGPAMLTTSGVSIFMILGLRRADPGVPSVSMVDCHSVIQAIDFKMMSGISYVYDALKPHIEGVLQQSVSEQLCSSMRSQVLDWDKYFSTLKMNVSLTQDIEADLSFISNPEITQKYVDLNLKGWFHRANSTEFNHSPAPMTLPSNVSSGSLAGISEASVNSLVAAYYSSGSINSMLSKASESINVTTSELIAAVPEISKQLNSSTPSKITLNATSSPKVTFKDENITVDFQGLLQIRTNPADGKSQLVLEKRILALLSGDVSMSDSKEEQGLNVSASIKLNRLQIENPTSNTKDPQDTTTENGIQQIIGQKFLAKINENLNQGMKILTKLLKNPVSTSKQGYELVKMKFNFD